MSRDRLTVPLVVGILALFVLISPSSSAAEPTLTFTPEVSSGGLGGRSAINLALHLAGTEYGGFPPPVTGIVLKLPSGTALGAGDHPTCSVTTLEMTGPSGCSHGSHAGPVGNGRAIVSFGNEQVEETVTVESFFSPGGGFSLFVDGHTPTSLELILRAMVVANVATLSAPLVSTVPGAPYVAFEELSFRLGESSTEEASTQLQSGLTLPSECPTGKLSWAASVIFDEGGVEPAVPETVEAAAETGCPAVSTEELQRRRQKEEEAAAKKKAEEEAAKRAEEALDKAILVALDKAFVSSRKSARLVAILKTGRFDASFDAPAPGTLLIDWYEIPKGARLSKKAQPILVASGRADFRTAGRKRVAIKLTRKGRQLLKRAKSIKLTSKETFTPAEKRRSSR